jgi:drug/metabolite transporter (DMT)-like permease
VNPRLRDWLLLLISNLIWASQFVIVKMTQGEMGPLFTAFFPILLSTVLVYYSARREPKAKFARGDVWRFIALGTVGQVLAQIGITWGVRISLASNAAVLSLGLPIVTALMARVLMAERMNWIRWISFALAIAGFVACSIQDFRGFDLLSGALLLGNALILLSVVGSAFYNSYSKTVLERHAPLRVMLYSYYATLVFLAPFVLASEGGTFFRIHHFSGKAWVGLAFLTVFHYYLSMVLFLRVLTRLDATQAAVSNYLIPFFGVLIAFIALGERMTPAMWIGGALGLASTFLATVYDKPTAAASPK